MLVLSRRPHEKLILNTSDGLITVMIADHRGDNVRVGIEAPKCVAIHREEVWREKQQEAEDAA